MWDTDLGPRRRPILDWRLRPKVDMGEWPAQIRMQESEDVTPQCGCLVGSAIHFAARLKHRIWRGLQAHLSDHSSALLLGQKAIKARRQKQMRKESRGFGHCLQQIISSGA